MARRPKATSSRSFGAPARAGLVTRQTRQALRHWLRDTFSLASIRGRDLRDLMATFPQRDDMGPALVEQLGNTRYLWRCAAALLLLMHWPPPQRISRAHSRRALLTLSASCRSSSRHERFFAAGLASFVTAHPLLSRALVRLLDDSDMQVRVTAAVSLCAYGRADSRVLATLQHGLQSTSPYIRGSAAHGLLHAGVKVEIACGQLHRAFLGADQIQQNALLGSFRAMGRKGEPFAHVVSKLVEDASLHPSIRGEALRALMSISPGSRRLARALQFALRTAERSLILASLDALAVAGQVTDEDIHIISTLLDRNDSEICKAAAAVIGRSGALAATAAPVLVAILCRTQSTSVLHATTCALISIGAPAIPLLLAGADDVEDLGRWRRLVALSHFGPKGAAPMGELLVPTADYETLDVLLQCLRVLGRDVIPATGHLVTLLDATDDPQVALGCIDVLRINAEHSAAATRGAIKWLLGATQEVSAAAERLLTEIGRPALEALDATVGMASQESADTIARVCAAIRQRDHDPLKRFRNLARDDVDRFTLIARRLNAGEVVSFRVLAKTLEAEQDLGTLRSSLGVAPATLRESLRRLEMQLGRGRLTNRRQGKVGSLSDLGREEYLAAEEYLKRFHGEVAS